MICICPKSEKFLYDVGGRKSGSRNHLFIFISAHLNTSKFGDMQVVAPNLKVFWCVLRSLKYSVDAEIRTLDFRGMKKRESIFSSEAWLYSNGHGQAKL